MVDQNLICLKHCVTGIMNVNEIRKLFRISGVSSGSLNFSSGITARLMRKQDVIAKFLCNSITPNFIKIGTAQ
jgi:hypothetical protein